MRNKNTLTLTDFEKMYKACLSLEKDRPNAMIFEEGKVYLCKVINNKQGFEIDTIWKSMTNISKYIDEK